ncbi:Cmx/CmrA family chloramphenicol efflux MFS transporter [Goodfellowiella coeruleoviolacea]|uniref:MFS transporter, DHA1 family, chloramphenicol resistance protein n=1 Tax=Goodfellowiella coeruleoviolacea TaxID=334858 RepID=A0AAE3GA60_9PSEU|nr:Cmx/CmrA family chloramphenicol efflux MFS transporter [Goodfellowiella coeruleoviolacea]MCP2164516.1 MFS transporter, DHA1 family, chloramphenicol resistance protein [Goodfellowiella coeruleoviolacea]
MPLAVYVLALGIFTQGTSEFMLSGLLPDLAADLHVSIPDAGLLVSAFAVGMVIGAPVLAVVTLSWPRRTTLVALQVVFVGAHVLGALATGYPMLFATRVISAVAYAGFWGVAVATAVSLVPAEARARTVALVASGLTLATIVGVPAGTVLSQSAGWRAAFWAVALLTAVSAVGALVVVPAGPARRDGAPGREDARTVRAELRGMARPQLWLSYAVTAFAFGAVIVTFSYLASLLTEVSGLPAAWVPAVLALFGVGGLLGMTAGGRLGGTYPIRTLVVGLGLLVLASALLAVTAPHPVIAVVLIFLLGVAGYVTNPVLQSRVFVLAPDAPTLVGAVNTAAFNVGNTLAPMLGGMAISAGLGFASVAWVGAGLGALGLLAAAWAGHLQYRAPARDARDTAEPRSSARAEASRVDAAR